MNVAVLPTSPDTAPQAIDPLDHLTDVLSSPIMINNDRILANAATSTLMSGIPASLRD